MNNEKLKENTLAMEDLDKVAGGTVKELSEICSAIASNRVLGTLMGWGGHVPVLNNQLSKKVTNTLLEKFNIKAKIHIGLLGTEYKETSNTYWDMGNLQGGRPAFMTHEAVIQRIKDYKG